MNHSAECSKVSETGDEGRIDRISSLPDELLVHILSSLSTSFATQTSLLSSRWRYLFTLKTNLSFSDLEYFRAHVGSGGDTEEALKTKFNIFVYGVLASHKISPIEKFSLRLVCRYSQQPTEHDSSHIHEWIRAAILKKVRHLYLKIDNHTNFVPECAFNSDTLVVLQIITHFKYLVVPEFVCLPKLKTLVLYTITFHDDDSAKRLIVGCPQLKELILIHCNLNGQSGNRVYISAKALQNLRIGNCRGHVVINAPKLLNLSFGGDYSTADLDVTRSLENQCPLDWAEFSFDDRRMSKLPKIVHDVITGTLKVRELNLSSMSLKFLAWVTAVEEDHKISYPMLESLHIGSYGGYYTDYVSFLLANSPRLETINYKWGLFGNYGTFEEEHWPPGLDLAPFSSNIKTVEVRRFTGNKWERFLLHYLLENLGALKRLILYKLSSMTIEKELEISNELLMLPKASSDFTLELETEHDFSGG